MTGFAVLLGILGVHFLAVISPGPDFVVAAKNSLMYSRRTGIWTAIGFGLGIAVHVLYCALGLALLISQSIMVYTAIKMLGAGYLLWLGFTALLSKGSGGMEIGSVELLPDISWKTALREGFLTNVLNPKATLFFLGLFTMVISPTIPLRVVIAACIMMVINTTVRFVCVAYFFTNPLIRTKVERYQNKITRALGGALVGLGLLVAFKE